MSSINQNQPEKNKQDLSGVDAVKKIREIVAQAENCFFCTAVATSASGAARPMNVRQVDDGGSLWFLSASDSHQNAEIAMNSHVNLLFQGSPHSDFLHLEGQATISRDKQKVDELWQPILSTWFTEGKDDPRITVIKFAPTSGYYWDTKHGAMVQGVKMMIGAMIGQTLDDSVEGKVTV